MLTLERVTRETGAVPDGKGEPTWNVCLVATGDDLFRTTLEALLADDQIDAAEYAFVRSQPLRSWVDFGGGAFARWSLCRVEGRVS